MADKHELTQILCREKSQILLYNYSAYDTGNTYNQAVYKLPRQSKIPGADEVYLCQMS